MRGGLLFLTLFSLVSLEGEIEVWKLYFNEIYLRYNKLVSLEGDIVLWNIPWYNMGEIVSDVYAYDNTPS